MSIHSSGAIFAYCMFLAGALGAVFGSFLNCAALRAISGGSVLHGRSQCFACGHILGPRDLVPVFSWPLLRGRCRYCGTKLPVRYWIAELSFAVCSVLCLLRFDLTPLCLRNWIFLCCLFYLTLTDLDGMLIPDGCLLCASLGWLGTLPFLWLGWLELLFRLAGALFCGGALLVLSLGMDRVLRKESLGGGDIKLFAVAGLYLGPVGTLFALLLSCVLGLLFVFVFRVKRGVAFPFGPAIAAAVTFMLFFGDGLVSWYLGLLSL